MKSFLKENLPKIIYAGIFVALVLAALWQVISNEELYLSKNSGDYGKDYVSALNWLRDHSAPGDVILSEWTEGHQVVNLTGRSVVATSKVYPSEATDVARRYQDIAHFFLAGDEKQALQIASGYNVKYVFIRKNFDWASTFNKISKEETQKIILDNVITPFGSNNTLIGKMLQKYEWPDLKPIFESKRFLIYKIGRGDYKLSSEEKTSALKLAREALFNYLNFGKEATLDENKTPSKLLVRKQVNITVWQGGELRGSQSADSKSIAQSIVDAAISAAQDSGFKKLSLEEFDSSVIEISIFEDNVPLARPYLDNSEFLGAKGFFLKRDNKSGYLLPLVLKPNPPDMASFLNSLCQDGTGLEQNCWQDEKTEVYTFDVQNFIEDKKDGAFFDLSKTTAVLDTKLDLQKLSLSLMSAADWLLSVQQSDGYFTVFVRPFGDANGAEQDWLRNAAAAWSLFEAYKASGQEKYLNSALRSLDYLRKNSVFTGQSGGLSIKENAKFSVGLLNFFLRASLDAYKISGSITYLQKAQRCGDFLKELQHEDGTFEYYYGMTNSDKNSDMADGQAVAALAELYRYSKNNKYLTAAQKAFEFQKNNFREKRLFGEEQSIAVFAWLVNASRELYDATLDENYAKFGIEVADWLIDNQHRYGPMVEAGSFKGTTKSSYQVDVSGTGKAAEALVDAFYLAGRLNVPKEKYLDSLKMAINWLIQMQYGEQDQYYLRPDVYEKLRGGLRIDYLNRDIRIDYPTHFLIAGLGLQKMFLENK